MAKSETPSDVNSGANSGSNSGLPQITEEMRERYLERRRKDFASIEVFLAAGNFTSIREVAHQLKGNAATFGYPDLQTIAKALECACLEENYEAVRACREELGSWLTFNMSKMRDRIAAQS